jgi:hypothetical protein
MYEKAVGAMSAEKAMLFAGSLLLWGVGTGSVMAGDKSGDSDEEVLHKEGVGVDNGSLLAYLRKRSANDADLHNIRGLVQQLGSERFGEREEASEKLTGLGPLALADLRGAVNDTDKEGAGRARECVARIEKQSRQRQR